MLGETISHYKIIEKLGKGGMGVVYKAQDTTLDRFVAIKFLPPHLSSDEEAIRRFIHEAKASSALDHSNIGTIHDVEKTSDGRTFIVMAHYEGETLRARIDRGAVTVEEGISITSQIAAGLAKAHEKGIVHRDIKPSNIILTSEGQAKIIDFGLAKLAGETRLTREGIAVGTAAYMSPEQARGEEVDHRSDIFSLGVLLYELLTGEPPFKGVHEAALLYEIVHEDPKPLESFAIDIPEGLQRVTEKALRKDAASRYQSIAELQADLKCIISGDVPVLSTTSGKPLKARSAFWLSGKLVVSAVVVIAAAILMAIPAGRRSVIGWLGIRQMPARKHLLVIPFTNIGDDPANQAFCDGLVETMTSMLTQMERFQGSLSVIPSSEVREFGISSGGEANRVFGVNLVVTGSVQRMGDRFRLTMNLVDAESLRQLRSSMVEDFMVNLPVLQDQTVLEMAEMLDVELHSDSKEKLTAGSTTVPGAYEHYIKGRGYLLRYESPENIDGAISMFERAISEDSLYTLAYAGLGEACWRKYELSKDTGWIDRARKNCNRALQLDDKLAPVHITLGIIHGGTGQYEDAVREFDEALELDSASFAGNLELALVLGKLGRLEEAEASYRKAIELHPDYWSGYNKLGAFYWLNGRISDAEKMFRKAIEIAPDNIRTYNNLIAIYFMMGDLDSSRDMYEKSISIRPNPDAYSNMATVYLYQGRYEEAIPVLQGAIELDANEARIWGNLGDSYRYTPGNSQKARETYQHAIRLIEKELKINPNSSHLFSDMAVYSAKSGDVERALAEIEQALKLGPRDTKIMYDVILIYEIADMRDEAIQAVRDGLEIGISTEELRQDPELVELRDDPRYKKLVDD